MLDNQYKYFCFINFQLLNEIGNLNERQITHISRYLDEVIMPLSLQVDKKETDYASTPSYQS